VERSGRFEAAAHRGQQSFAVLSVTQGFDYLVEVDGAEHRISGGEAGWSAPGAGDGGGRARGRR